MYAIYDLRQIHEEHNHDRDELSCIRPRELFFYFGKDKAIENVGSWRSVAMMLINFCCAGWVNPWKERIGDFCRTGNVEFHGESKPASYVVANDFDEAKTDDSEYKLIVGTDLYLNVRCPECWIIAFIIRALQNCEISTEKIWIKCEVGADYFQKREAILEERVRDIEIIRGKLDAQSAKVKSLKADLMHRTEKLDEKEKALMAYESDLHERELALDARELEMEKSHRVFNNSRIGGGKCNDAKDAVIDNGTIKQTIYDLLQISKSGEAKTLRPSTLSWLGFSWKIEDWKHLCSMVLAVLDKTHQHEFRKFLNNYRMPWNEQLLSVSEIVRLKIPKYAYSYLDYMEMPHSQLKLNITYDNAFLLDLVRRALEHCGLSPENLWIRCHNAANEAEESADFEDVLVDDEEEFSWNDVFDKDNGEKSGEVFDMKVKRIDGDDEDEDNHFDMDSSVKGSSIVDAKESGFDWENENERTESGEKINQESHEG